MNLLWQAYILLIKWMPTPYAILKMWSDHGFMQVIKCRPNFLKPLYATLVCVGRGRSQAVSFLHSQLSGQVGHVKLC